MNPAACVVFLVLGITLAMGLRHVRLHASLQDFVLDNQPHHTAALAATLLATGIGAGITLGNAQRTFRDGLPYLAACGGLVVGELITALLFAPRIAKWRPCLSVGEIMGKFYGTPGRILTGLASAFRGCGVLAAQVCATGQLCQFSLGMARPTAILTSCSIVVVYSAFGGMGAIVATDILQAALILIGIPLTAIAGIIACNGPANLLQALPDSHLSFFDTQTQSPLQHMAFFALWCVPFLGPCRVQRFLMAKNPAQAKSSMLIAALVKLPLVVLAGMTGLIAVALQSQLDSNIAMPFVIHASLPKMLQGLALAGLLAATMSSADSYLHAAAITLVHDVAGPLRTKPLSDKQTLRWTQGLALALGICALAVAIFHENIIGIILGSFHLWHPVVAVPLIAGFLNIRANTTTFCVAALAGLATSQLWGSLTNSTLLSIGPLLPGLMINTITFSVMHALIKRRS